MGGVIVSMTKKENKKNAQMKIGDDAMSNAVVNYNALNLGTLMKKKGRIVSSEEALRNVKPIEWGEDVLRGERKITVTKAKE